MTSVTTSKADNLFGLLDVDNDETISARDLSRLAESIIDACGDPQSPDAQRLRDAYLRVWQDIADRSDNDRDGQVTRQEFAQVFAGTEGAAMRAIDQAIAAEFEVIDTDNDGDVSTRELVTMLSALGVQSADLEEAVTALDTDGDGRVAREEYVQAMREFYRSDDPTAPVNRILGRLR
ncbi:MAG TPA: EF-hand domain-containing protein [Pilimelia sp.]|nr:EF-hand domain-containing protein [Pilimelia sp.]